jgi:hypothetical protein
MSAPSIVTIVSATGLCLDPGTGTRKRISAHDAAVLGLLMAGESSG